MGKRKRPDQPTVDEVRAPHRRAALLVLQLAVSVVFVVLAGLAWGAVYAPDKVRPWLAVAGGFCVLIGVFAVDVRRPRRKVRECRDLIEAEHHDAAIPALKELMADYAVGDDATYLIALAYDRQGAHKLALGSYQLYLDRFLKGNWVVEARVRVEELTAAVKPVKARPTAVQANCPFCKSELLPDAPAVECAACETPHHAGCYEEQGGCAVYGCESKTARARVRS